MGLMTRRSVFKEIPEAGYSIREAKSIFKLKYFVQVAKDSKSAVKWLVISINILSNMIEGRFNSIFHGPSPVFY